MEKRKIPSRYIIIPSQKGTRATRSVRTGMFTGRRTVSGTGDRTKERFLRHDTDLDHDGKIGPNERGGTLQGRNVAVRASRTARGHTREL